MANPVTQSILQKIADPELAAFVTSWDDLESLVIDVFRTRQATPTDEQALSELRPWLAARYPRWRARLEPSWRMSRVKGERVFEDPFLHLLKTETAAEFVGNWDAMRYLPAARQALNLFLLDLIA